MLHKREEFLSDEEYHFACYLSELKDKGLVTNYQYEPEPFLLLDKVDVLWTRQLKTKEKSESYCLFQEVIYTVDFKIEWSPNSDGILTWNNKGKYNARLPFYIDEDAISYIEVKPEFDINNMTRAARIKMAWVMDKYGIHIDLIRPYKLFEATFFPMSYMYTSKGKVKQKRLKGHLVPILSTGIQTSKTFLA